MLLLFLFLKLGLAQEVCYPSVARHRIDSVFPTSQLFCVSRQNDEVQYSDVSIIQSDEQWKDYALSRGLENSEGSGDQKTVQIFDTSENKISVFKIPAGLGDKCTGVQVVEKYRNITVNCKPLRSSEIQRECAENEFLNSQKWFGAKFVEKIDNRTVTLETVGQLMEPVWNGTMCLGTLREATIRFHLNGTSLSLVTIEPGFAILPASLEPKFFELQISIIFQQFSGANNAAKEELTKEAGYQDGDHIYAVNGMVAVPFSVPSIGPCISNSQQQTPIRFERPHFSTCTISANTCAEARTQARNFYNQLFPNELLSAPSDTSNAAFVRKVNASWDDSGSSGSLCRLPVSAILQIFTSRQGTTKRFWRVIVAGTVQINLDYLQFTPTTSIHLPILINFCDVTPPPTSVFASLPYIDVRLPSDFFYPFLRNSNSKIFYAPHFCIPLLILRGFFLVS